MVSSEEGRPELVLKQLGNLPSLRERLMIFVIGVISMSRHSLRRKVGIGSIIIYIY